MQIANSGERLPASECSAMDVIKIISELRQERERLDQAIRSLERLAFLQKPESPSALLMSKMAAKKPPDTSNIEPEAISRRV